MDKRTYTHNKAFLILLVKNNGKWVSINHVRRYTGEICKSECFNVNSRASNLRLKYGYPVENDINKKDGVTHSSYKLSLSLTELKNFQSKIGLNHQSYIPECSSLLVMESPAQQVPIPSL